MTSAAAASHSRDVSADARSLRALHKAGDPLLLANVWDPPTARVVEATGMRAIATASAAIAPTFGYEDHSKIPAETVFDVLRRIVHAVRVPVSADLEDGYGLSADGLVSRVLDAGVCGLNLEDTDHSAGVLIDAEDQAERIAAVRNAACMMNADLVINARIDVAIHRGSIDEGLRRARRYLEVGADCVYPILVSDLPVIKRYVEIGPTNILWRPGGPRLRDLVQAGVSRISLGPLLHQKGLKHLASATNAFRAFDDERI